MEKAGAFQIKVLQNDISTLNRDILRRHSAQLVQSLKPGPASAPPHQFHKRLLNVIDN